MEVAVGCADCGGVRAARLEVDDSGHGGERIGKSEALSTVVDAAGFDELGWVRLEDGCTDSDSDRSRSRELTESSGSVAITCDVGSSEVG